MPPPEMPAVLLIDDDLVSREVTATLLTLSGYTVQTAESGEAALELLKQGESTPSVILMDAQMPGLSGVELIGRLRGECGGARIFVISASQPAAEVLAAADGLLMKPFDAGGVRAILEQRPGKRTSILERDEPVISLKVLNNLRKMMPEKAVRDIYTAMVADLDQRVEALAAAIERRDGDEVRRIGHSIKGGCAMAGAMQAARIGAMLESEPVGRDNQLDNSNALLADLRAAVQELHRILDNELPA